MVRTLFFALYFWVILILTLIPYVPLRIACMMGRRKEVTGYIQGIVNLWARNMLWVTGAQLEIYGLANLPREHNRICFVSNHQGYADIVTILGCLPRPLGFISKLELTNIPILGLWMRMIQCVFVKRDAHGSSGNAIAYAADCMKDEWAMVIFPEGTRSKGKPVGPFKPGVLKLVELSGATVVPISVQGSFRIWEEKGKVQPARIRLVIHQPMDIAARLDEDPQKLLEEMRQVVMSGLSFRGYAEAEGCLDYSF
ncbi:MAG: lysophospholipid acyltransferase family protein [Solirubrobacterales bacterium]